MNIAPAQLAGVDRGPFFGTVLPKTVPRRAGMIDTITLLWQINSMPPKRKGFFNSMPYGDRVILVLAVLLFAAGQIIGALLNRLGVNLILTQVFKSPE